MLSQLTVFLLYTIQYHVITRNIFAIKIPLKGRSGSRILTVRLVDVGPDLDPPDLVRNAPLQYYGTLFDLHLTKSTNTVALADASDDLLWCFYL